MSIQYLRQEKIDELRKFVYVGSLLSNPYNRRLTVTSRLSASLASIQSCGYTYQSSRDRLQRLFNESWTHLLPLWDASDDEDEEYDTSSC